MKVLFSTPDVAMQYGCNIRLIPRLFWALKLGLIPWAWDLQELFCKALRCLRLPNWVEESSPVILIVLCWYLSPPAISPVIQKKISASLPAPGCPCEPALRGYPQEWPMQYHQPITRSGQPRAGQTAGSLSRKPLGPTPTGTHLHPSPAPPVQPALALRWWPRAKSIPPTRRLLLLTRPCVIGQCALLTPDQTPRRALCRASPRCSVRRCKSAQWFLWRMGAWGAAACGWAEYFLLKVSSAGPGRLNGRPRTCMTLILYYGPGKFGQLPAPSCRKQLCRANSLYLSLLSSFLTWTLKNEKMHARAMLIVFLTFASFASVHVSLTHVTGPLTWTLKQAFLNSIQLTWTFIARFLAKK